MSLKTRFKQFRNDYVIRQVAQAELPPFSPSPLRRCRVLFSGRVQKVGFRLEVCELARRLGLTGFCKNLENGDVLAEIQGEEDKIHFLLAFMGSLKRIRITKQEVTPLPLRPQEEAFTQQ